MRPRRFLPAFLAALIGATLIAMTAMPAGGATSKPTKTALPVKAMEKAMHAKGSVVQGVLQFEIDRTDISGVHIGKVPIKPSFEINGTWTFQPTGKGQAFMNSDIALEPSEMNSFIDALLKNGFTFQAEHQHMYDFKPIVYFIHLRGTGSPVSLAKRAYNALREGTSTPFPQAPPAHPKTPLNPKRLETMLHGFSVSVGSAGVVTVLIARNNKETIAGIPVRYATNIMTNVSFEPLNKNGSQAAVIPDYGMIPSEINAVVSTMRSMGWDIGCLYNQETAESPQLFFSHMFKVGNPYTLAGEVEKGLDHTNSP